MLPAFVPFFGQVLFQSNLFLKFRRFFAKSDLSGNRLAYINQSTFSSAAKLQTLLVAHTLKFIVCHLQRSYALRKYLTTTFYFIFCLAA